MRRHWRTAAAALSAALVVAAAPARAGRDDAPDWLETSMKSPLPTMAPRTPLVELIEQEMLDVSRTETKGRVREAFRILTTDGLRAWPLRAEQRLGQDFRLVDGWIVRPDGSVVHPGTKAILQVDADGSYEFTMNKINMFRPDELRVGDVLAWEYEVRSKTEAYVTSWRFGWTWPTVLSRFGLKLPQGWTHRASVRNHEEVRPARDDDGYLVWEMRQLPPIKDEPMSPPVGDLVPTLAVQYGPAAGGDDRRQFDSWQSVGRWYADLVAPQTVADDSIRQTTKQTVAGTAAGLDSIRAVTRFVQGVRYLNVALGRSSAEPHPAAAILKNRFGDCEDKSVLTITMLRQIGADAYPILARTRQIGDLQSDFPAPNLFNHAIVAIKAPEGADLPSTVDAGALGRVVIFDPTDSVSGLGDLSPSLQGTKGVLSSAEGGGLITLPVLAPETSERVGEVSIAFPPEGGIAVNATYRYTGQYAAAKRWHYGEVRGDKRKEEVVSMLVSHYGKAEMSRFDVDGVEKPGEPVTVAMALTMKLPGRELGSMRTLATQFLLGSRASTLNESERKTPLRIDGGYRESERTTVQVPQGWRAALPLPELHAACALGDYRFTSRAEGGTIVVDRELTVKAGTVLPADYAPVKKFFDDVARGDAAVVAMEKIPSGG